MKNPNFLIQYTEYVAHIKIKRLTAIHSYCIGRTRNLIT